LASAAVFFLLKNIFYAWWALQHIRWDAPITDKLRQALLALIQVFARAAFFAEAGFGRLTPVLQRRVEVAAFT
jgi:uncharacterized membrane protein YwzB